MITSSGGARVEVKTSPLHGRGLFASTDIPAGTLIGVYPLLILSHEDTEHLKATRLYHYVFYVDERADGAIRAAVAFGNISMCNHSRDANSDFIVDAAAETVTLTTRIALQEGAEILIDYEDFADEAI
ncbi:SET domain-containing protein-lysine N-methyltransferase [Hyphomonas sp. WL0036]|uniref:SET domain-containing protein n=1 Tax=Hyphomonas sediminis TaxID=2866160 RepID=UPI001C80B9FB|nr:SET domain-containing protein-lysine N-methyltransferase [Hyphomonas sediminis]MBY9067107.1 SET domain-containing protein-lysine N-methyltransferase [Hyphomonas sediminis]